MHIDNDEANRIVRLAQGGSSGSIQRLMEMISDVQGYRQSDPQRQGYMARVFYNERGRIPASMDFSDIVAVFWEAVMKDLARAAMEGDAVSVRHINETEEVSVEYTSSTKKSGEIYVTRKTKMNPIYWLRRQGYMAVRNYLNDQYRDNWNQVCGDCGAVAPSGATSEITGPCQACNSMSSEKVTMRKRTVQRGSNATHRKCTNCGELRKRVFGRVCKKCGSHEMHVEYRYEADVNENVYDYTAGLHNMRPDEILSTAEAYREAEALLKELEEAFPRSFKKDVGDTQVRKIFRILMYPEASVDMCAQCKHDAGTVCAQGCHKQNCSHDRKVNPAKSCGSESFQMDKCINYSKKIGAYLGYTGALANRRVQKIRQYVEEFLESHSGQYPIAKTILKQLQTPKPKRSAET